MKILIIFFFIVNIFIFTLNAKETYESQSNIIFKNKILKKQNNDLQLKIDFNNAVLYLEQEQYIKAINIFKKTANQLKVPSFLNIAIAYYKLELSNNAYLYLKKLYDLKNLQKQDLFSYLSASYYLYQITNDRKYISSILKAVSKKRIKNLNEGVKLLLANTYIITKQYNKSILILNEIKDSNNLKLALLYLKVKNYPRSEIHFKKALKKTKENKKINQILWFEVYLALKTNNLAKIQESIDLIQERIDLFTLEDRMPLKIYFNKNKYSTKEYFNKIMKFDKNRQIDMLFYFTPFIFSNNKQIEEESTFAFILKEKNSIKSLELMLKYNKNFLELVKLDPIIRASKLQKHINKKTNIKAYEYYNLAISYAQIYSYKKAYKYFNLAYKLNKAHKLYNVLTLVSAKKANINISKNTKTLMLNNLMSKHGTYRYYGQYIYKIIFDNKIILDDSLLTKKTKNTTFYKSLKFLQSSKDNNLSFDNRLIQEDTKDPLVFLLRSLIKQEDESQYDYVSRLQDYLPKNYNDYFLKGPLVITEYYIDILKALGIFDIVNFQIKRNNSPTYLRTKALINLYDGYPIQSIKIIENLQEKYQLNDKSTFLLLVASYLSANDYSNATATLGMMQFELKNKDAKFLNGIELLHNLKLKSAKQAFKNKYEGKLIDFKLEGFDEFLENL